MNIFCKCKRSVRTMQYICVFSVTLLSAASFMHTSWTSPTIPLLTSPESPIGVPLTQEEASWVVSGKPIGLLLGSIPAGILMEKIGRKKTLLLAGLLLLIPWIIIIFSVSFAMLITARILAGFAGSLVTGVLSIYIGEISDNDIRGRLSNATPLGGAVGSVIVLSVGPFVSFTTLALICAAVPVLFFVLFFPMPESPYYLVKTNQERSAREVLRGLIKPTSVDEKLKEIQNVVQQDELCKVSVKSLLSQRNYRKSLGIVLALKTLQQFSGTFAINSYIQTIMETSNTSLSAETSSLIFAAIQIPCVVLSAYLVDKVGRRPLLITSAAGCAIALAGEGIYFFLLEERNLNLSRIYFLPTLCLTLYFIMSAMGVNNLSYVVAGELFANNVKKVGGSLFAFYSGLLTFVSTKIFSPIVDAWGMYVIFWIFALICVLGVLFGWYVLPETKGKSFEEIQRILHGEKRRTSSSTSQ